MIASRRRSLTRSRSPSAMPVRREVSGLVLNFVPDHAAWSRAARHLPGGTIGVYVWDYAGGMQLMRHFWDAAIALDPAARELDEAVASDRDPNALRALFRRALRRDPHLPIVVPTVFRDFDDYWSPFLSGRGPPRATACPSTTRRAPSFASSCACAFRWSPTARSACRHAPGPSEERSRSRSPRRLDNPTYVR